MAVLYTKYRPKKFSEVVGQKAIVNALKNAVIQGKVSHAYLFTGSRGVGKTTLARILAKALNCLNQKGGEPCLECAVCTAFANGNFLDCVEIDAASNTGVDNIRELIEHIQFRPSLGKYKVYIIDEVHMLSKGAFNALLKTLEEPPKHAVFILATTEIQKVPQTVISRTQRFDFGKIKLQEMSEHLGTVAKAEKVSAPTEIFNLIAEHAGGSLRDALSRLDKVFTLGDTVTFEDAQGLLGVTSKAEQERLISFIAEGKKAELPQFFNTLAESSVDFFAFNRDLLEYMRELLSQKVMGKSNNHAKLGTAEIVYLTRLFLKSYKDLAYSPNPELPLLLAAVEGAERFANPPAQKTIPSINTETPKPVTKIASAPPEFVIPKPEVQTISQELVEADPAQAKPLVDLSESDFMLLWPQVLDKLRDRNGPLATLVKNSPVVEFKDYTAFLGVKYLFHKEHLESAKNAKIVAEVITEVYNAPFRVSASIIKQEEPAEVAASLDVLQVFGGEIIE